MARQQCEFFLVKYVPDPVRNEFVHVGVILRGFEAAGGKRQPGQPMLRFTSDWKRVRCLDPEADTGMLESLESELRRRFLEEPDGNLFHVLEDSFSNSVQVTRAKGYLAESMEAGVEELMRLYVEPQRRPAGRGEARGASRLSGRPAVQLRMRTEFERAGVWDLLRKRIRAAEYTRAGDPLRIDYGYRAVVGGQGEGGGLVRMFHAVSLDGMPSLGTGSGAGGSGLGGSGSGGSGVEMAKILAFSVAGLRRGVERVEKAAFELTAVVEPLRTLVTLDGGNERDEERTASYRFAVETMEEHGVRVVTTADMDRVAETARLELKLS